MRITFIVLVMFLSLKAIASEQQTILGFPSIDNIGIITISECNTGKEYKVGTMASNPYFHFSNKIIELSKSGSVLVKVRGVVVASENLEIAQPKVISVLQGECSEAST